MITGKSHDRTTGCRLMGSYNVTCHPTQANTPRLNQASKAGTRFTYPGGIEGWVDQWLTIQLPGRESNPRPLWSKVRRSNRCATILHRYFLKSFFKKSMPIMVLVLLLVYWAMKDYVDITFSRFGHHQGVRQTWDGRNCYTVTAVLHSLKLRMRVHSFLWQKVPKSATHGDPFKLRCCCRLHIFWHL